MAGTKEGGEAAARTNKAKYGEDFYGRIGAKGGKIGRTGGFAANRELARTAGAKGGSVSRRGKAETCYAGHALVGANVYKYPGGTRGCLACRERRNASRRKGA